MWPSVRVQLTLVLTRRGNVGTEVATNKQGIRRCTGRSFKASWSLGKTIRTPRTDGHQGYAQRLGRQELLCPQSPSLRGHQPCPHRGSDLGLHAFRTLRLRRHLWYEVIQLMVFFVTEQLVQVLHWPQFLPLWEGVHLCFLGKFRAPSPSSPSSDDLTIASGNTSVPQGGPLPLLWKSGGKGATHCVSSWPAVSPRHRLTLSTDKTRGHTASGPCSLQP